MESMNQREPTQLLLLCLKEPRPKEVKRLSRVPQDRWCGVSALILCSPESSSVVVPGVELELLYPMTHFLRTIAGSLCPALGRLWGAKSAWSVPSWETDQHPGHLRGGSTHTGSLEVEKGPDSERWGGASVQRAQQGPRPHGEESLKGDQCDQQWNKTRSDRWEGGSCPASSDRMWYLWEEQWRNQ